MYIILFKNSQHAPSYYCFKFKYKRAFIIQLYTLFLLFTQHSVLSHINARKIFKCLRKRWILSRFIWKSRIRNKNVCVIYKELSWALYYVKKGKYVSKLLEFPPRKIILVKPLSYDDEATWDFLDGLLPGVKGKNWVCCKCNDSNGWSFLRQSSLK